MQVTDATWGAYRRELTRFIASRVRDHAIAEDLVHEVLLRAYSHRDQLKDPGRLRAWLYRITRHAIADHYRANRPTAELPDELPDETPDQVDTALQELARCLEPLMRQLPRSYSEPLVLADLQAVPQAEIAQRLGISLSGAKSRVQRARAMLKAALLDCCRVEQDHRGRLTGYERPAAGSCSGC